MTEALLSTVISKPFVSIGHNKRFVTISDHHSTSFFLLEFDFSSFLVVYLRWTFKRGLLLKIVYDVIDLRRHLWRDTWNETNGDWSGGDLAQEMHSNPGDFGRSEEDPNDVFLALVRRLLKTFGFNFSV